MRLLMTLLLVLPPLFFGDSLALTNEEATNILKELIKTEFKILEIREAPLEGFWEVVSEVGHERMIIYIHKNLRFMIHGQILDRQIKKNLTLDRLKDFRRVDPSGLPLENAIPMGEGKRKLYVFTDPQCYFCFQLHEELKQIKDLQTFFFLYPLTPASYEKAKSIWCSQDKVRAIEETYQGKELRSPSCDTSPIDKNMKFGKRLLIDSTPTLLFQNGKMIEGFASPNTLENLLKSNSNL
ncbi:MAG: DsbC family protein [Desulfobacterales bacterium]|nr:DsbC family protein [Desulfobacterales bacterium]